MFLDFWNFLKVLLALIAFAIYGLGAKALLVGAFGWSIPVSAGVALVPVILLGVFAYIRANNPNDFL